jgi:hypothetical protein
MQPPINCLDRQKRHDPTDWLGKIVNRESFVLPRVPFPLQSLNFSVEAFEPKDVPAEWNPTGVSQHSAHIFGMRTSRQGRLIPDVHEFWFRRVDSIAPLGPGGGGQGQASGMRGSSSSDPGGVPS